MVANNYCDSLLITQEEAIVLLEQLIERKESIIFNLEGKIINLNQVNEHHKASLLHYEEAVRILEKALKRQKFFKTLLSIGVGILTVLAII